MPETGRRMEAFMLPCRQWVVEMTRSWALLVLSYPACHGLRT